MTALGQWFVLRSYRMAKIPPLSFSGDDGVLAKQHH